MSGFLTENKTRIGFEIEPTNDEFKIKVGRRNKELQKRKYNELNSLTNKTLAETSNLEFVVDDVKIEDDVSDSRITNVTCQIEFRTKPMVFKSLDNMRELKETFRKEIKAFYEAAVKINSFRSQIEVNDYIKKNPIAKDGKTPTNLWRYNPNFNSLSEMGLEQMSPGRFDIPVVFPQHATISVPISNFLALDKGSQEKVLGYEASDFNEFILNYLEKIVKAAKRDSNGKLVFNTNAANRTRMTPNIKTGLDKIILTANEAVIESIKTSLEDKLSKGIQIQIGSVAKDFDLSKISVGNIIRSREYNFPEMSIEEGDVSLTSEEKVKPLFIDNDLMDIRVLVEYRDTKSGFLKALYEKDANKSEFNEYIKAFKAMDEKRELKPDRQYFSEFFAGKTPSTGNTEGSCSIKAK